MILFYEKQTGKIIGTIDGRIHNEDHLKMWIGDPTKIGRMIIEWAKDGATGDYRPDFPQEDIARELDAKPILAHTKYKIHGNGNTMSLIKI